MHDIIQRPPTVEPKPINGHKLGRKLRRGLSPAFRALLAFELEHGTAVLHHLTRRQATALTQASWGYVATVSRLSPQQREQVMRGQLPLAAVHTRKCELTDAAVDRLVAKIGAEKLLAALDRFTAPTRTAAE